MILKSFRIQSYRSIIDSGVIEINKITPLIGENDSGKTNLLTGLALLNPIHSGQKFNKYIDSPNFKSENKLREPFISTIWELTKLDQDSITKEFPVAKNLKTIQIEMSHENSKTVQINLPTEDQINSSEILELYTEFKNLLFKFNPKKNDKEPEIYEYIKKFKNAHKETNISSENINSIFDDISEFKNYFDHKIKLPAKLSSALTKLINAMSKISVKPKILSGLSELILGTLLPKFIHLEEFPIVLTNQSLNEFLNKRNQGSLTKDMQYYLEFCELVGVNLDELQSVAEGERESFFSIANTEVTKIAKDIWRDNSYELYFRIDGDKLNVMVLSGNVDSQPARFESQGFGFRTHFSLAVSLSINKKISELKNSILLLDEPGLHLHAQKQMKLIDFFLNDIKNQILYTTHSPFLIPMKQLELIRPVYKTKKGTSVLNSIINKQEILFPLQSALGYEFYQNIFFDQKNLVVEGITDFIAVTAMSVYLNNKNNKGLDESIVIIPSNGVPQNQHLAIWLSFLEKKVILLQDYNKQADEIFKNLSNSNLLEPNQLISVADILDSGKDRNVDLEDLIGLELYSNLIKESYKKELGGKKFEIEDDENIQLLERAEKAFEKLELGITFNKRVPINLLSRKVITSPDDLITKQAEDNFSNLFEIVNARFKTIEDSNTNINSN